MKAEEPPDDETIALMMMEGDREEAFRLLVNSNWSNVVGFLRKYLGGTALCDDDFEDAAQEALRKLFEKIDDYDSSRGKLTTLWCQIAYHEAINLIRRETRDRGIQTALEQDLSKTGPVIEMAMSPEGFRQLFTVLTDTERKILESDLVTYDRASDSELAARLDLASANSVQVLRHRAKSKIRDEAKRRGLSLKREVKNDAKS